MKIKNTKKTNKNIYFSFFKLNTTFKIFQKFEKTLLKS